MTEFMRIEVNKKSLAMRKPIYGVGINDAWFKTQPTVGGKCVNYQPYRYWKNMLERCYSDKYHARKPTYQECEVCEEWQEFSYFDKWLSPQDYEGLELDKDILVPGNKLYSPDTCILVPRKVNSFITDSSAAIGEHPVGVRYDKLTGNFQAQCNNGTGKKIHLGCFESPKEAHKSYLTFKITYGRELAETQPANIKKALNNWIDIKLVSMQEVA